MKRSIPLSLTLATLLLAAATARGQYDPHPKTIDYSLEKKELLGKKLKPDVNNRLKIRMLVDWGQLEVFAAGGVLLNEVARTWPDKAT